MHSHLRIARPVSNIQKSCDMYCIGLNISIMGKFEDHAGFDGVILGASGVDYHFEFTYCRTHPVLPMPTSEDVSVFYIPVKTEWEAVCNRMLKAGFEIVDSFNPYWEVNGRTFQDHDGYRIVLQNASWKNRPVGS